MEYFEKAADNDEAGAHYNLGVMYFKGIHVKKDVKLASKYFIVAANAGQSKAFYQLAKMFHTGVGLKKNLATVSLIFKLYSFGLLLPSLVLLSHMVIGQCVKRLSCMQKVQYLVSFQKLIPCYQSVNSSGVFIMLLNLEDLN